MKITISLSIERSKKKSTKALAKKLKKEVSLAFIRDLEKGIMDEKI